MNTRSLVLAVCSTCLGSLPPTQAAWTTGFDVTAETWAGQSAGATAQAQQGIALAVVEWQQPKTDSDGGVRFHGYASALSLAGHGPTARFLGDLLGASNIEGSAGTRLYSTWLEATLGQWSVRAGALLADEEFAGTTAGSNLLNSSFGWPAFISANTVNTGPAFYAAAAGVRVQRRLGEGTAWRLGVYDGDSFDSPAGSSEFNRHGWRYRMGRSQGAFAIGEVEFAPGRGAHRVKVGGWLHTARFADLRGDIAGQSSATTDAAPRQHPSNHGIYLALERTIAGDAGKPGSIDAFLRGGVSPADRNTLGWALDGGIAWTGALRWRPHEVTALGITHAHLSRHLAAQAREIDADHPISDETVIELSHRLRLSEHFSVVPDVQFISHPGGSRHESALVWLLRLNASL